MGLAELEQARGKEAVAERSIAVWWVQMVSGALYEYYETITFTFFCTLVAILSCVHPQPTSFPGHLPLRPLLPPRSLTHIRPG